MEKQEKIIRELIEADYIHCLTYVMTTSYSKQAVTPNPNAMASGGVYGGYDYNFVDGAPPDRYICTICKLVSRDPQQTNCCGNTFCNTCLSQHSQVIGQNARCPLCNEPPLQYFNDAKLNREIISLKVYCTNSEEGCKWKGTINETDTSIEAHLYSCPYQLIPCTNECGGNIRRNTLETHLTVNCPKRLVKCEYCQEKLPYCQIKSDRHLNKCPDYPLKCSNEECAKKIPRGLLESHNETCPKAIITCEYNTVGCNKKMKREEKEEHNKESVQEHLQMTKRHLQMAKETIESLRTQVSSPFVAKLMQYTQKTHNDEIWYSPGFYTSPGGYRMMLHVYTNGTSSGKGTHVSCGICLLPGEYDDKLEWPFQGEVTIELLNQLEDMNHVKGTIHYNESTSEKCKQIVVAGTRSKGWGAPRFIPHSELEYNPITNCQYLKDDSLYFRVSVKVTSKTKPWLAVSANGFN